MFFECGIKSEGWSDEGFFFGFGVVVTLGIDSMCFCKSACVVFLTIRMDLESLVVELPRSNVEGEEVVDFTVVLACIAGL